MPNGLVPPGSRAILIGSAASIKDLGIFAPQEEGAAEGALMLMRLDFADFPTSQALAGMEKSLRDAGVPTWPGYPFIVYADTAAPSVYLAWQKGIAWMPIIIGMVAVTVLPMLLGGLVWLVLPQSLKDLLTGLVNMGMMVLVMFIMAQIMKPLTAAEKPKKIRATPERPELEEVKA